MKRRSFLSVLGLAPLASALAAVAAPAEVSVNDKTALNAENAGKLLDEYHGKISAGTITASMIAANSITADKISCPSCTINHGGPLGGCIL